MDVHYQPAFEGRGASRRSSHYLPRYYPTASSSTVHFRPELPTELWTRIFRLATGDPVHISTTYIPFANHSAPFIDPDQLRIKAAIVLVCKRWRALGLQFLYEEIRIPNTEPKFVSGLLDGLQRVEKYETEPNNRHVRRIVLSSTRVDFDLEVLKCCPSIEVVIKPVPGHSDNSSLIQRFPFPDSSILSFNLLQRIEWSFPSAYRVSHMNRYFAHESLTVLWHIMQLAPNLLYLSITGETPWLLQHPRIFFDLREQLQNLRVLRTHKLTSSFVEGIASWRLPNLTHLITDSTPLLRTIQAHHIRVVDLVDCPGSPIQFSDLHHALASFTELEELCYIVGCFQESRSSDISLPPTVQCVRLRVGHLSIYRPSFVDRHLQWLCGPTLPSLKQVILYGDWTHEAKKNLVRLWTPRFEARQCALLQAEHN